MAMSVSSERAFLQGSITISKRCNRLKGDIVEALQCLKCFIWHDLLFREMGPSSAIETAEMGESTGDSKESWNVIVDDDNDNEFFLVDNNEL